MRLPRPDPSALNVPMQRPASPVVFVAPRPREDYHADQSFPSPLLRISPSLLRPLFPLKQRDAAKCLVSLASLSCVPFPTSPLLACACGADSLPP
eukprot:768546-Hanusia_phi.AAC.5